MIFPYALSTSSALEKLLGYYLDGKLLTWLKDHHYDAETNAISALNKDSSELPKALCDSFDIPCTETNAVDVKRLAKRQQSLALLRQYCSDTNILSKVDIIAFDQADLERLISEGHLEIFIFNNAFFIPLEHKNIRFICIDKGYAEIRGKIPVNFKANNISFSNTEFSPDARGLLLTVKSPQERLLTIGAASTSQQISLHSALDALIKNNSSMLTVK